MTVFRYFSPLLLLSLLLHGSSVQAQTIDSTNVNIFFSQEQNVFPPNSWTYKIVNWNPTTHPVNRLIINMSDTFSFSQDGACAIYNPAQNRGWEFCLPQNNYRTVVDSVEPSLYGGTPFTGWDSTFVIIFDTAAIMHYTHVNWTAWYNGQRLGNGGTHTFFSRYDNFAPHDTVSMDSVVLPSGDPGPRFTLRNLNGLYQPITAMRFRLDASGGNAITIRPSELVAPDGWVLGHATATDAYFFTPNEGIPHGGSISGFQVGVHTVPGIHDYAFEWTAYAPSPTGFGVVPIDYDTVRRTIVPGGGTNNPSNDTLLMSNINGCAYNIIVENFHAPKVSSISRIVLATTSPNVTISSVPTLPNGWAGILSSAGDSLYIFTQNASFWLQGGLTNKFTIVLNNQKPDASFAINWTTYDSSGVASTGTMTNSCTVPPKDSDLITFAPVSKNNCRFIASVINKHYPNQSNDRYVTFQVLDPKANGKFGHTPAPGSSLNWNSIVLQGDSVIRFNAPANGDQLVYATQFDTLTILPNNSNRPFPIQWVVQDTDGKVTGHGVDSLYCVIPPPPCDLLTVNHSACGDTIQITNLRLLTEGALNQLWIMPQGGWKIDTVLGQPTSQKGFDTAKINVFVAHNSKSQNIIARYIRKDSSINAPFSVIFETYAINGGHICDTVVAHSSGKDCPVMKVDTPTKGVANGIPSEPISLKAYPNPFSGKTEVSFTLPQHENVDLVLIDIMGRVVQKAMNGVQDMGQHSVTIDGAQLEPGTYYLRLETPFSRVTKKLVIDR